MKTRREFLRAGMRMAAAAGTGGALASRFFPARAATAGAMDSRASISTTTLAPGIALIDGAGCNVLAAKGPDGSLLVDGGYARHSRDLLKAAAGATGNSRVAVLINTHWHPAQTGSNEAIGAAGGQIIAHEVTRLYLGRAVTSVDFDGKYGPLATAGLPVKTTRTEGSLSLSGKTVSYGYLPAAHTNGDLYVHLRDDNILVGGGPVCSQSWPLLDWRNGAWLGGLVKAHEKLAALAKPDTRVIPANGRVMTGAELKAQHQMFAAFHEQMVAFLNKGMDSGDCIAARPLQPFESQYGDAKDFIRGAFHSLNLAYSPD